MCIGHNHHSSYKEQLTWGERCGIAVYLEKTILGLLESKYFPSERVVSQALEKTTGVWSKRTLLSSPGGMRSLGPTLEFLIWDEARRCAFLQSSQVMLLLLAWDHTLRTAVLENEWEESKTTGPVGGHGTV